jgi:hypothetical protein
MLATADRSANNNFSPRNAFMRFLVNFQNVRNIPDQFQRHFSPLFVAFAAGSMNFALSLSRRSLSLAKIDLSARPLGQSPHTQPHRWARALFIFQMVSLARFFASRCIGRRRGTPRRSCRLLDSRHGSLRMSFLPVNFAIIFHPPSSTYVQYTTYVFNTLRWRRLRRIS